MERIKCEYCKKLITKGGYKRHYESCKRIIENKNLIEEDYLKYNSIAKLEKIWHIDHNKLSDYLKLWGYKIETMNDMYKNDTRLFNVNDNFLSNLYAPQYWFIGLMASDGNVSKNQFSLSQSGDDGKILIEYVNKMLKSNYKICEIKTDCKISYSLHITSKKIINKLKKFNIIPNKTLIYKYPTNIPLKYVSCFLAGYVEGDGCITITKGKNGNGCLCASFVGTKDFIYSVSELIPIKGSVRKHNSSSVYEIRWNGEKAIKFCDWLYSNKSLYHSYKYKNYIKGKEIFENSPKEKYRKIKEQVLSDFKNKNIVSIAEYIKNFDINERTIYAWRKKWKNEGLL